MWESDGRDHPQIRKVALVADSRSRWGGGQSSSLSLGPTWYVPAVEDWIPLALQSSGHY